MAAQQPAKGAQTALAANIGLSTGFRLRSAAEEIHAAGTERAVNLLEEGLARTPDGFN